MRTPVLCWTILARKVIDVAYDRAAALRDSLVRFLQQIANVRQRGKQSARLKRAFREGTPLLPNDRAVVVAYNQPFRPGVPSIPCTPDFADLRLVDGRH